MRRPTIIVNKSTVPIGTGDWVADIVRDIRGDGIEFSVVSNPEFLREGSGVHDFMNPDRIVLGSTLEDEFEIPNSKSEIAEVIQSHEELDVYRLAFDAAKPSEQRCGGAEVQG